MWGPEVVSFGECVIGFEQLDVTVVPLVMAVFARRLVLEEVKE